MSKLVATDPFQVLTIGDVGWDDSTQFADIIMAALAEVRNWKLTGNIVNLFPAMDRAVIADRTWKSLGLAVPVAAGMSFQINPLDKPPFDERHNEHDLHARGISTDPTDLVDAACQRLEGQKLHIVNTGGFPDIQALMELREPEFRRHVGSVTVMSGVRSQRNARGFWEPNEVGTNIYNLDAAEYFYEKAQEWGIPLTCVTREAVHAAGFDRDELRGMLRQLPRHTAIHAIAKLQIQMDMQTDWVWKQVHLPAPEQTPPGGEVRKLPIGPPPIREIASGSFVRTSRPSREMPSPRWVRMIRSPGSHAHCKTPE